MTMNKDSGLGQITAVSSMATAIGVALLALRKRKDTDIPGEYLVHLDEETLQLLIALAAAVEGIKETVEGLDFGVQGFPPNCTSFVTFQVPVLALTPRQLPNFEIPEGFSLVVKSHPNNPVGTIMYVARSGPDVQNFASGWPLVVQESLGLAVTNSNAIWVSATVGSVLCCVVEQR